MTVSMSKKKGGGDRDENKAAVAHVGVLSTILYGLLYRIPMLLLLSIFLFIWSSSTMVMSGSILHVCVSSRKLNDLYCLSAGSHPNFHFPIIPLNATSTNADTSGTFIDAISSSFDAVNTTTTTTHTNSNGQASQTVSPLPSEVIDHSKSTTTKEERQTVSALSSEVTDHSKYTTTEEDHNDLDSNVANTNAVKEQLQLHNGIDGNRNINGSNDEDDDDDRKAEIAYALEKVEEHLRFYRSWTSNSSTINNRTCDGRGGLFVYDLPSKFNKDLLAQCAEMMPWEPSSFCESMENEAMGRPIPELGKGWYGTHQYALEPLFHARALRHPCRVNNPNEAKLFYVPYYGGLDILRWHFKNVSDDVKDALGRELVDWLGVQKSWDQNKGKDHVFVLGKISWDFRRTVKGAWGTSFLEQEQMENPIKLMIERQPWKINDIGIPHPTHFHPQSDDDIIAWQSKVISSDRKNLVTFAGAARPDDSDNTRSILINQCTSRTDGSCTFLDCKKGDCKPETLIDLFTESEFCLQPRGDSPTRKSVFDSLVAGCIPVIFDPFTAYYQYPWHLPEDHGKYSVFVDKEELKQMNLDVVENLKEVPKTVRDEMRRFIVYELLPGLVYGDPNAQLERFQDAFSISINHLLNRVSNLE